MLPLTSTTFPGSKDQSVYLVEFYAPWYGTYAAAYAVLSDKALYPSTMLISDLWGMRCNTWCET